MSPLAGTRLGPAEIQSAIGAGGMGEVYEAGHSSSPAHARHATSGRHLDFVAEPVPLDARNL
jgi:hypothetical protein